MLNQEDVIKQYLKALELGSYEDITNLFAVDATVKSPLYGFVKASQFYKDLLNDTSNSITTLKNIFISVNQQSAAAQFEYIWTLKSGQKVTFEVVDIFEFDALNKIKNIAIIYDTYNIRPQITESI